ncbi:MAG: metallophosphoesterase [Syntrophobacterales bacterium]|nr:metallophosphoesterase [Syntrophobacterales bacterium]
MKVAVISDTHLTEVIPEFERICHQYLKGADLIIHLGDWTGIQVFNYLSQYPLLGVSGNSDTEAVRRTLPLKRIVRIHGYRVGLTHGWGSPYDLLPRLRKEFRDVDVVLFGHSHIPFQMVENGILWLNPGSLFHGRGEVEGSLAILYLEERIWAELIML